VFTMVIQRYPFQTIMPEEAQQLVKAMPTPESLVEAIHETLGIKGDLPEVAKQALTLKGLSSNYRTVILGHLLSARNKAKQLSRVQIHHSISQVLA